MGAELFRADGQTRTDMTRLVIDRFRNFASACKMDLQQVGWVGMDWIDVAENRNRWWALVGAVMNLRVA